MSARCRFSAICARRASSSVMARTMHGGGQAGDRGATEAAVVEDGFVAGGRAVDSLKGRRHEIGRRSNSWIRPSALMVAASSSSATWSKLHRGLLALGQIIEAELDCRIA
jgi:hypothetical protein